MTESKPAFCFVVLKKFDKNILFVYFETHHPALKTFHIGGWLLAKLIQVSHKY